jgi:preprotein translocase subunit SecG
MLLPLAISGWFLYPAIFLFVFVSIILILLVLVQKGRGGGLAGAFGGGGGNTAFGAKTGDVLTWATSIIFGVFLLLAIVLNLMTGSGSNPAPTTPTGGPTPAGRTVPANPNTPTPPGQSGR